MNVLHLKLQRNPWKAAVVFLTIYVIVTAYLFISRLTANKVNKAINKKLENKYRQQLWPKSFGWQKHQFENPRGQKDTIALLEKIHKSAKERKPDRVHPYEIQNRFQPGISNAENNLEYENSDYKNDRDIEEQVKRADTKIKIGDENFNRPQRRNNEFDNPRIENVIKEPEMPIGRPDDYRDLDEQRRINIGKDDFAKVRKESHSKEYIKGVKLPVNENFIEIDEDEIVQKDAAHQHPFENAGNRTQVEVKEVVRRSDERMIDRNSKKEITKRKQLETTSDVYPAASNDLHDVKEVSPTEGIAPTKMYQKQATHRLLNYQEKTAGVGSTEKPLNSAVQNAHLIRQLRLSDKGIVQKSVSRHEEAYNSVIRHNYPMNVYISKERGDQIGNIENSKHLDSERNMKPTLQGVFTTDDSRSTSQTNDLNENLEHSVLQHMEQKGKRSNSLGVQKSNLEIVTNRENKNDIRKVKSELQLLQTRQSEIRSKIMARFRRSLETNFPKKLWKVLNRMRHIHKVGDQIKEFELNKSFNMSNTNEVMKRWTKLYEQLIETDKMSENETLISPTNGTLDSLFSKRPKMRFFQSRVEPPKDICEGSPFLIVYVHSAVPHFINRLFIRKTWGNPIWYKKYLSVKNLLKVVFVLGKTEDDRLQRNIEQEADLYNDMLIGDFIDSYRNLTYKAVYALGWVSDNCKNAKYVLKVDDDLLVDVFKLYRFLAKRVRLEPEVFSKNLLACCLWGGMDVIREVGNQWYVPRDVYNKTEYPEYCSGNGYIMTPDLVSKLYSSAHIVDYFFIDDVYVTGFLMQETKLRHLNINYLYGFWNISNTTFSADSEITFVIPQNPSFLKTFWLEIIGRERNTNINKP